MQSLLTEVNEQGLEILTEANEAGGKNYFIEGIFLQSEKKNRNGRVYPRQIMEKEILRYNNEYVSKNRAIGELGHPNGPSINLERVSHLIKNLRFESNDVMGKAKIMDTPYGKIAKNMIDEGVRFGVSSRAMGSLERKNGVNYVKDDFMLSAVDIVADPSGPDCWVSGLMEGAEWTDWIDEELVEVYREEIRKTAKSLIEERKVKLFNDFLRNI